MIQIMQAPILRGPVSKVVRDWAGRVATDERPDNKSMDALDLFYRMAVSGDWWDDHTMLMWGISSTTAGALIDVKNNYTGTLSIYYAGDDPDEGRGPHEPYIGYSGDGNTYFDFGLGMADLPGLSDQNMNMGWVWQVTNLSEVASPFGAIGGGANWQIRTRNSFVGGYWNNVANQSTFSSTTGLGLTGMVRASSSSGFAFKGFRSEVEATGTATTWTTGTAYVVGQQVNNANTIYVCLVAHTAGATFSSDLNAGRWQSRYLLVPFTAAPTGLPSLTLRLLRSGTAATPYSGNTHAAFGFGGGTLTNDKPGAVDQAMIAAMRRVGIYDTYVASADAYTRSQPTFVCFTRDSRFSFDPPDLEVYQLTSFPQNDTENEVTGPNGNAVNNYVYPFTHVYGRPWGSRNYLTGTNTWCYGTELIWADRGLGDKTLPDYPQSRGKTPNDSMSIIRNSANRQCRPQHSTYERARYSTLVKTMWSAGYLPYGDPDGPGGKGWVEVAAEGGYDVSAWDALRATDPTFLDPAWTTDVNQNTGPVMHWAYANANANSIFTVPMYGGGQYDVPDPLGTYSACDGDIIILGLNRSCNAPPGRFLGFHLDFEIQDDRSSASCLLLLQSWAAVVAGKGYHAFISPLDLIVMSRSGFTADIGWKVLADPNVYALSILAHKRTVGTNFASFIAAREAILNGDDDSGFKPIPYNKIGLQASFGIEDPRNDTYSGQLTEEQCIDAKAWMTANGVNKFLPRNIGEYWGGSIARGINQGMAIICGFSRYEGT